MSDKALKFWMSEKFGKNFCLNFLLVKNVNKSACFIPCNNINIGRILMLEKYYSENGVKFSNERSIKTIFLNVHIVINNKVK